MNSFDEWWKTYDKFEKTAEPKLINVLVELIEKPAAKEAWEQQQKKIDKLSRVELTTCCDAKVQYQNVTDGKWARCCSFCGKSAEIIRYKDAS